MKNSVFLKGLGSCAVIKAWGHTLSDENKKKY